jgi:hypothetical protein
MNRILRRIIFLILCLFVLIMGLVICKHEKPSRYQIITAGGTTELMDMKTLDVYYSYGTAWHKVTPEGIETVVEELPK